MDLKDLFYSISYVTQTPVKDVAESICRMALADDVILNGIAENFRRGVHLNNVFYNKKGVAALPKRIDGERGRISIRFSQSMYDTIGAIAYALDCRPSRAVAIVLEMAVTDGRHVGAYLKWHVPERLGWNQYHALTEILNRLGINFEKERLLKRDQRKELWNNNHG